MIRADHPELQYRNDTSWWGLSISSNSTHGVGGAPHFSVSLTSLLVAPLGSPAGEPPDGTLCRSICKDYIDPDHLAFSLRRTWPLPGNLHSSVFPAGGAQEQEGADGALPDRFQPRRPDGPGHSSTASRPDPTRSWRCPCATGSLFVSKSNRVTGDAGQLPATTAASSAFTGRCWVLFFAALLPPLHCSC